MLDNSDNIVFTERNQGYNTLQFYTCDISSNSEGIEVVGGLQDNGTLYLQLKLIILYTINFRFQLIQKIIN